MSDFVLVPGAWLGRWAWDRVTPVLRAQGHRVVPVTLPGLADRAGELRVTTGLNAHVADVVRRFGDENIRDAVLVGHSYAGAVIGAVARRVPRRVRAQVYVDTMPLEEGAALIEGFSPEGRARFERALATVHGARVWPVPEPLGSQAPVDGLTSGDLELIRSRGTPHPALGFTERLAGPTHPGPYPKSHGISSVENEAAGAVERKEFLTAHPDWTYHHLSTGHWPMLSTPTELSVLLERIARE